jgi:Acetyltransferase (GNAT) domain/PilZ domain
MIDSRGDVTSISERRAHQRFPVLSLAPIDLGKGTTGTVLNLGEGGLAVRMPVIPAHHSRIPRLQFRLPISGSWVEISGQIVWESKSKTEVGIKFIEMQEETHAKIRDWISQQSSTCRIREVRLDQDWQSFSNGWKECNSRFHDHTIHCDPDWIEQRFNQQKQNVHVYLFERDRQVVGAVPFVLSHKPLLCKLGESIVAKFPMRTLTLQGYTPNMPEEPSLYDVLFTQLLHSAPHVIQLSYVRTASLLWNYLHRSELIQKSFSFYSQFGPLPHPLIHLTGSFDSYIGKFSPKARKNRLREIKRLRALGEMQFIRVTKASEIDAFLEAAHAISRRTWQFLRHRWGISARDFDQVRREMYFLAQRGWLRGYLLKSRNAPCSFIIGQQYGQTLYTAAAGVHPAWRSYSAGTVLLLLVLEDLFQENSVQFYDLGDYAKYKEHFANESYQEASVWLFSRRLYPRMASGVFRSCNAATKTAGALLEQFHLKSRVRQLLWG